MPSSHKSLFNTLDKTVKTYLSIAERGLIKKAYQTALAAHTGQLRQSGEPYICHPVSVAIILAELNLESDCIIGALLHDCIEDTELSKADITHHFGNDVADLVDGVSKLSGLKLDSLEDRQAENFKKLLMAMNQDIRVILVKIADRLHNMRTLVSLKREKQLRIAQETLDIYAQITKGLGLYRLSLELEDLSFKALSPYRYRVIKKRIRAKTGSRKKVINSINRTLKNELKKQGYQFELLGRVKSVYSIYNKIKSGRRFNDINDIYAFRLIVDNLLTCYQVLGVVHNLYKPIPGKFKDYIALPKSNGYQSLHTVLFADSQLPVEIQVRTKEMNNVAEHGIAAHWDYKLAKTDDSHQLAQKLVKSLLNVQKSAATASDFLDDVKANLFANEVLVFTPKGHILQLPNKATALDFAYAIHTDIGDHCHQIKVDQQLVPLSTELRSGQTITVITDKKTRVHPNWLQITNTGRAKSAIKLALRNISDKNLIALGRHLLKEALLAKQIKLSSIKRKQWQKALTLFNCLDENALLLKIGLGEVLLVVVLNALLDDDWVAQEHNKLTIKGTGGMAISFANCCYPIAQDRVIGIMTKGKGLVVHRTHCGNVKSQIKRNQENCVDLTWHDKYDELFKVAIRCEVENSRGALAQVTNTIAMQDVSIEDVTMKEQDYQLKYFDFILLVKNREHVAHLFREIKKSDVVHFVHRL